MSKLIKVKVVLLLFCVGGAFTLFAAGLPTETTENATPATDIDVILLIVYILLALIFSFACSVAEAVLLSITPSYIAGLKEKAPALAATLKKLKQENVDRSLAAILTLNTIAHTVGAIGSGAKAVIVFGNAWFGLFSALMTLLILFLSEIIPKTLGAVYWRKLAGVTAVFVNWLIFLLYPLILVSEKLTKFISGGKGVHVFSRDEFVALADIGTKSGQIKDHELRILKNLFRADTLCAEHIMTPRIVVRSASREITVDEFLADEKVSPFSRVPLYNENPDDSSSFVLKDDVLLAKAQLKGGSKLSEFEIPLKTVSGTIPISGLLDFFLNERVHICLVIGEYGGMKGIVTLEDVVETLLGMEIMDEKDHIEDMQEYARKRWQMRAEKLGLKEE